MDLIPKNEAVDRVFDKMESAMRTSVDDVSLKDIALNIEHVYADQVSPPVDIKSSQN
jgi:hypothetical protein